MRRNRRVGVVLCVVGNEGTSETGRRFVGQVLLVYVLRGHLLRRRHRFHLLHFHHLWRFLILLSNSLSRFLGRGVI